MYMASQLKESRKKNLNFVSMRKFKKCKGKCKAKVRSRNKRIYKM